jgi:hypothetical protein
MAANPSDMELALLQRLRADEMIESLTRLDEHAWDLARAVLRELAARQNYPMNTRKQKTYGEKTQ